MPVTELARLYADPSLDVPNDQRPLPAADRMRLRQACRRFLEVAEHPLLPFKKKIPEALQSAFEAFEASQFGRRSQSDFAPADLLREWRRLQLQLRYFSGKHFALQRVRRLCRTQQEKWVAAGALAPLDAVALHRELELLVAWHLALHEGDGSYSVHPAVRDHFARLAASNQGAWHDLVRAQMLSLARRPGQRLPEDPATLDLIEEAIYHALQAGQAEDAAALYQHGLGGLRHLGWRLGEMTRGRRVLRGFAACPDSWGLAWYERALGELEEAYRRNPLAHFRADIRLLQGRLPDAAAEADPLRTPVALFLMGQLRTLPGTALSSVVPREQCLLYLGRLDQIRSCRSTAVYEDMGWEGDRARCQLIRAEAARRQADHRFGQQCLDDAARWVLHSGSVEHLCLWHLVRGRLARSESDRAGAQRALDEGLHVARHCGLGLYHLELLCTQAEVCLAADNVAAAESAAREALERAAAPDCQFRWAEAEAGHLLGQALALQERRQEARAILTATLALRSHLHDPRRDDTQALLSRLT